MLRHTRWSALLLCSTSLFACTSSHSRCRAGTPVLVGGELRCVLDGGSDAGGDVVDVPPVMCGADGGVSMAADPVADGLDQNCDGVDGVLANTIFVAGTGVDVSTAGTTPDAPVRSLPFALQRAMQEGRSVILMRTGVYDSSQGTMPSFVTVDRSMTIVGRYTGSQWITRDTSATPMPDTVVSGPNVGIAITGPGVTLRGLTVEGVLPSAIDGVSVYGVFAVNAPNLTLQDLIIKSNNAAPGRDGRPARAGAAGSPGGDAVSGMGGVAGRACAGVANAGGGGGDAGVSGGDDPTAGASGQVPPPRTAAMGGPAGTSGAVLGLDGTVGTDGASGRPGTNGGLGTYGPDGFTPEEGASGEPGEAGGGGGGGGGAYSTMSAVGGGGGGGGGGGCGGDPGTGGQGGGGSFGVYLYGRTTVANIINCSITSRNGGRGGNGGIGDGFMSDAGVAPARAPGGEGGAGAPGRGAGDAGVPESRGGRGGRGGLGGVGGAGGPGIGGPSVGVVRVAGASLGTVSATTYSVGDVGANGLGNIDTPRAQYHREEVEITTVDAGAPADAAMTDASAD